MSKRNRYLIWLIAIYIRLSKENREQETDDESRSIKNQRKIMEDWLAENFTEPYEIVDIYADDGLTGTTDDREHFSRMIKDVEAGKVNCVVTKSLPRAFRNYADQGYYLEQYFPLHDVRFIATGKPYVDTLLDPDAITSGMEIPINGLMNDRFAAKTSMEVRRTFEMKRKRGEFIGGHAPYGYAKDPEDKNHLVIDEQAAAVVRDIFSWYVNDGMSIQGLVHKLNDLGIPCPSKYKQMKGSSHNSQNKGLFSWSPVTVKSILNNQMYVGDMVQGRQRVISYKVHKKINTDKSEWYIVPDTHERIIDRALFESAKNILARNTRTPPGNRQVHLFSGFLRCSDCGGSLSRRKSSKSHVYYTCRTYKEHRGCTKRTIREDRLEQAVLAAIQTQISLVDEMADLLLEINQKPTRETSSTRLNHMLKLKVQEFEQVKEVKAGLLMDVKTGRISEEDYADMRQRFESKAVLLKDHIQSIQDEMQIMSTGIDADNQYIATFKKLKNVASLDRAIITELIDKIYLHNDGQITIDFNCADEYKNIIDYIENNQRELTLVEDAAG